MKKILSLLLAAVMLVGTVGVLSGCGKKDDEEIRIYVGDQIYDFDPALAFVDDNASRIMGLLFEPLFRLEENGKVSPALAKGYKIIEDEEKGLYQMEIELKETYWNDGKTPVLADDLYFAWTRILDSTFASQAAPLLYDVKNAAAAKRQDCSIDEVGLEANKRVFTITFEGKIDYDAFLRNLTSVALSPIRQVKLGVATEPNTEYWAKRSAYIATNGPYAIRSWNRLTGEFTLQKNEYYHVSESQAEDGKKTKEISLSRINMQWTDENFQDDYSGDINEFMEATFENLWSLAEVAEDAIFCVGSMPMDNELRLEYLEDALVFDALSTYSLVFNTTKEPFNNEVVRRALSMVIDREYIAAELVFAKAADGLISPAVWDTTKQDVSFRSAAGSVIDTTADVRAARKLVKDMEFPEGIVLTVRDTADEHFIAEYVARQWRELGLDVEVKYITMDTEIWATEEGGGRMAEIGTKDNKVPVYDDGIQAAYISGQFDVLGLDYNMYSTNAFTALCGFTTYMNGNGITYYIDEKTELSAATNNLHCSNFSDAKYDEIMNRAFEEKDLAKKALILHEAEAYLLEKLPIMPIVYNQNYYIVEEISGLEFDGYGNPIFNDASLKVDLYEMEAIISEDEEDEEDESEDEDED